MPDSTGRIPPVAIPEVPWDDKPKTLEVEVTFDETYTEGRPLNNLACRNTIGDVVWKDFYLRHVRFLHVGAGFMPAFNYQNKFSV